MTEKLYDRDSHLREFDATVIGCEKTDRGYEVELDRTAFFPESGGQSGDRGTVGGITVTDTQIRNGRIFHICASPVTVGEKVRGVLDFEGRFRKMQNHSGEHIVSSIIHKRFGYSNVGFHLGSEETTFDFNGEVKKEELSEIEKEANLIVASNVEIRTYYPTREELSALEYRSKGELEGDVRMVEIVGVDMCACCAPHVSRTGEIGMIKILGAMRYKGGIRIRMKCGLDALDDFCARIAREEEISRLLCVPQEEIAAGTEALAAQLTSQKHLISDLKFKMAEQLAASVTETDGNVCLFSDCLSGDELRALANLCVDKCNVVAACSGSDGDGYLFVCASKRTPLRALAKTIGKNCNGKCGGSDLMLSGRLSVSREIIKNFFEETL